MVFQSTMMLLLLYIFFYHFIIINYLDYLALSQVDNHTHQLTELHNQEERDALTAFPQTLKDVGMLKAPGRRTKDQT